MEPAPTARGSGAGGPATPTGGTCWRVQLLAPLDAKEAERVRATAASLLLVAVVVEPDKGRYKVRTHDCMTRDAAELLRRRAIESGFTRAFRISGAAR